MREALIKEMDGVRAAISEAAASHHHDLCVIAEVGFAAEESMEQKIENASHDVLDAVERVKQSQRSHKDVLLDAFLHSQSRSSN
jgi:hypothetical protein